MLEDVGDLVAVQARVHGDGDEPRVPGGELDLEVLGPVGHDDREPVAGLEAERAAEDPKVFTQVKLIYKITGRGLKPANVERAVNLSAESPTWRLWS